MGTLKKISNVTGPKSYGTGGVTLPSKTSVANTLNTYQKKSTPNTDRIISSLVTKNENPVFSSTLPNLPSGGGVSASSIKRAQEDATKASLRANLLNIYKDEPYAKENLQNAQAEASRLQEKADALRQQNANVQEQARQGRISILRQQAADGTISAPVQSSGSFSGAYENDRGKSIAAVVRGRLAGNSQPTLYSTYPQLEYLSPEDEQTITSFANAGRYDLVETYYDNIARDLNAQKYQADLNNLITMPGAKGTALRAVTPVVNNLFWAPAAYVQTAASAITGNPVDVNAGAIAQTRLGQAAQEKTVGDLGSFVESKTGSQAAGKAASFLGNVGYSVLNNAVNLAFGPGVSLVSMGLQAAGQSSVNALERGAQPGQALAYGTVSGALEGITEKIPMDNLFSLIRGGKQTTAQAVRSVLRQAGIEASEETVNSYLGALNDMVIMGENSEYNRLVSQLTGEGMDASLAAREAAKEIFVAQPLESALSGAVSGGIMAGGASAAGRALSGYTQARQNNLEGQAIDRAYSSMLENGMFSQQAREETARTNSLIGLPNVRTTQEILLPDRIAERQAPPQESNSEPEAVQAQQAELTEQARQEEQTVKANKKRGLEIPIEERTWQDAGNRRVNAYQYDNPDLRPYFKEAAMALSYDLGNAVKGERIPIKDQDGYYTGTVGVKRSVTDAIEQALDNANLSYSQIQKAIDDLIADNGQENYAAAKKVELILDDMLTNGFVDSDGQFVEPNQDYIYEKQRISGQEQSEENWQSILAQDLELLPGSESVGAARKGFDPWSEFQGTKSEFFPEGANAARPVDVPTTDQEGRNIRKTASTAMGAKAIPDQTVRQIEEMVLNGRLSYDTLTDRESISRAVQTIENNGFQQALGEFRSQVEKGVVSKDLVTLGQQLLVNAANAGDENTTAELLTLYAQMETSAGQAVQAASILRKLSPSSQLYAAQKIASNLEQSIYKKLKGQQVKIDPSLIEEFNQQTDQAGRDAVMEKIYQNLADQIPSDWRDKWNAWRYISMLANPRTHIRNIAGNIGFQPVRMAKNEIGALLERLFIGQDGTKTKSFLTSPDLYKAAWKDFESVREVLSGNKYDDIKSEINSRRTVFEKGLPTKAVERITGKTLPIGLLEAGRKGNSWLLEAEDLIFKRITYADSLAQYLAANGVTAEQLSSGQVNENLLSAARDYAGQEALKATYQDRNQFSNLVSSAGRYRGDKTAGKVASAALDAVLPFRRTPANILVRGVEYSPIGLTKSLTADLYKVKQGKMSAAQAIDNIASGLTGTLLLGLGAALAAGGFVTGGAGDDEKQNDLNDLTGGQNYALNLPGGGSVTLDWLAPEALPFFMGVELANSIGENGLTGDGVIKAISASSEPMLEMSMLQSLNDMIDSVSYVDGAGKLTALASSALISYLTQAIPTIGGQIERSAESKRMSTYTDKDAFLPTDVQYAVGRASSRIPGLDYQQIPYIDAWGREEETGTLPMRVFNNFLNPAYTSSLNVTPVDSEIQRLYTQTGISSVVPSRASKSITVNGEKINLDKDQYVEYAKVKGQTAFDMLSFIFDTEEYQALTDAQKADLVSDVYEYSNDVGKSAVSGYEADGWVSSAKESEKNLGISSTDYILLRQTYGSALDSEKTKAAFRAGIPAETYLAFAAKEKDADQSGGISDNEMFRAISSSGMTKEQKSALYAIELPDWTEQAEDHGINIETYAKFKAGTGGMIADKDENGNSISGSKKAKIVSFIEAMDISTEEKDALYFASGYSSSGLNETPWH